MNALHLLHILAAVTIFKPIAFSAIVVEESSTKPGLAITLPVEPHWKEVKSPVFDKVYMGSPGDVHYIRYVDKPLAFSDLKDIDAIRMHYRKATKKENGGIISVEVKEIQGLPCVVYISKEVKPKIRGYRYVARCVFPLKDTWVEVRMDAIEMGPTGGREAVVSLSLGADPEYEEIPEDAAPTPGPFRLSKGAKRIKGYNFDPYDKQFNSSAINSIADDVKYDKSLPNHPLSRLRSKFPTLLKEMKIESAK